MSVEVENTVGSEIEDTRTVALSIAPGTASDGIVTDTLKLAVPPANKGPTWVGLLTVHWFPLTEIV